MTSYWDIVARPVVMILDIVVCFLAIL